MKPTPNKPAGKTPAKKTTASSNTKKSTGEMENTGLRSLFEDELKDIYWAEKALTKAIPKMIKNATSEELSDALQSHLEVTEEQVTRCEEVFQAIGTKAEAKKCKAMEGLIKEADEIVASAEKGSVRDAAIISAAQKVEHYEIASYGTLAAWARQLGEDEAADLLEMTLNEEKEADASLTEVAQSAVNEMAMSEEEEDEE